MNNEVEILHTAGKIAVIKLPSRKFPGVLIPADSLFAIMQDLGESLSCTDEDEMYQIVEDVLERLRSALEEYVDVMVESGHGLPFSWQEE